MKPAVFEFDPKWAQANFMPAKKKIVEFEDVTVFEKKRIHQEYLEFLVLLQQSISGKRIIDTIPNDKFRIFDPYFAALEKALEDTPPFQQPQRFGNKAFRDWTIKANEITNKFLDDLLPEPIAGAKAQLLTYVSESWGSSIRIDYGTGHQLSFMFFCWALFRLGFCKKDELENLVRELFYKYIRLMRKVQLRYMLEPAGSHGVWGIDDYQFLTFVLGASELVGNEQLASPDIIHNKSIVDKYAHDYMYLNCIKFIMEVKVGVPFSESSPVLANISGAASWTKITQGMPKMYKVEVLGKHPVIKHQYFGTVIPYI